MNRHPLFDVPLPEEWQVLTVDEIKANEKSSCVAGPFGSSISSKYFETHGVPVIRGCNLREDLTPFVADGFVFVSTERAKHYQAQHVRGDDLVFTCWGTLGQVGLVPTNGPYAEYIISNKQLKLRPNRKIADSRFLFYYFASPQMVQHIRSIAIGAAVPGINLGLLKGLRVALPPLKTQERIVSILSRYDDLIENGTRRIKILEEIAQMIYREWFVNFRFPGHQRIKMVESEVGPIPAGWRNFKFSELLQSSSGGDWGSDTPTPEDPSPVCVIRGTDFLDIQNGNALRIPQRFISASSLTKRKLVSGDIVVENSVNAKTRCTGSALLISSGILRRIRGDSIAASFCRVFRLKRPELAPLAYLHLRHLHREGRMAFYQNVAANGIANFQTSRFVDTEQIVLPEQVAELQRLMGLVSTLVDSNSADRIDNLRKTRDLLLPKLISGKINVRDCEPEAVAQGV